MRCDIFHHRLVLDNIYTRLTKRLCYRPQVPEGKPREPGRPGRRHRRQVRLPQPVGLGARALAVPVKDGRLDGQVGPGHPGPHLERRQQEALWHGGRGVRGHHPRRRHGRADTGEDAHGEPALDEIVPPEGHPPGHADHGLVRPDRSHDVEVDVPHERPGVLDPLPACGPRELACAPCPDVSHGVSFDHQPLGNLPRACFCVYMWCVSLSRPHGRHMGQIWALTS